MKLILMFYNDVKVFKRKISVLILILLLTIAFSACGILHKEEDVLAPPLVQAPKIVYDELAVKKSII